MSARIQQFMAYVIAIGMIAAVAAVPTMAQTADPDLTRTFETAGFNADKVDGKHAVAATKKTTKRAGKLVATNTYGFLPSNIVKPFWAFIKDKPAGFADGVDNEGVTGLKIIRVFGPAVVIDPGTEKYLSVDCPAGSVPTGGGIYGGSEWIRITGTYPRLTGWGGYAYNTHMSSVQSATAEVVCLSLEPGGDITTARKGVKPANKRSK